jgi:hypothetical protein
VVWTASPTMFNGQAIKEPRSQRRAHLQSVLV